MKRASSRREPGSRTIGLSREAPDGHARDEALPGSDGPAGRFAVLQRSAPAGTAPPDTLEAAVLNPSRESAVGWIWSMVVACACKKKTPTVRTTAGACLLFGRILLHAG